MSDQRFSRWIRSCCPAVLVLGAMAGGEVIAEIPEVLETIVFGDEKRVVVLVTVNDVAFDSLATFSAYPYLMWPAEDEAAAPFGKDRAAVLAWLDRAAPALGYEGFETRFTERSTWRENEVWNYALVREGLPMHDARIEVHWGDAGFLGIVNHIPGRIAVIEPKPDRVDGEWVYYPVRTDANDYRMVPSRVDRVEQGGLIEVSIMSADGRLARIIEQGSLNVAQAAEFTEYPMPLGTFPDQISVGEDGLVWLSQPFDNWLTSFDPKTAEFVQNSTTGGSGPDGMIVGTQGRVWSGMYFSGSLGYWDSIGGTFHNFAAPYSGAAMAIPVETSDGNVWVTDHERNRISEFDPVTGQFLQSVVMPTGNCWVVQGHEDSHNGFVYFTEFNANQLGKIAVGGSVVTDIQVPGGGPAFCVYSAGRVYYSRWNESGIGAYDVDSGQITEYAFPVNESGGPMWLAPNGNIVTGTRNRGHIVVFDPDDDSMDAYLIPTPNPGLKDGMTVGPDGVIWFTETGAEKLAKLVLCPDEECLGDLDGNGAVDFGDILAILSAWGNKGGPEDLNGNGIVDFGDILIVLSSWGPCE